MNLIVAFMLLAIVGCKKPYILTSYPVDLFKECADTLTNLRPFWKIPIRNDTSRGIASVIVNTKNGILVYQGEGNGSATLLNKLNGSIYWQKNSFARNEFPGLVYNVYENKNSIVTSNSYFTYSYSNSTGEIQWSTRDFAKLRLEFRSSLIGNFLYTGLTNGDQFFDSSYFLSRLDLSNPTRYDTLFELKRENHFGYMGGIEPPALYINKNTDSILLFKFRTVLTNSQVNTARLFFYAFNLNQRKVQWRIDSLDYEGSIDPPIVEGNKCYVQGLGTIYCLNAEDGSLIWKAWCGGRLPAGSNMISYKDRLAVITLDGRFICVDKETGNYIFNRKDAEGGMQNFDMTSPSQAVELNGVMYVYGSGYFYGIDLTNGTIVMKYKSPYRCKRSAAVFAYGGIAKDDALGLIYIEDQYFVMAVKAYR